MFYMCINLHYSEWFCIVVTHKFTSVCDIMVLHANSINHGQRFELYQVTQGQHFLMNYYSTLGLKNKAQMSSQTWEKSTLLFYDNTN